MKKALLFALSALLLNGLKLQAATDFALRDGDTVVFLGDSITAARGYGKIIENYTLLRYPQREVRFVNAGHGGDTAEGGFKRLERDVFSCGATVLTVAYGINDIGWGMKADAEHRQRYLDGIRGIVERCRQHGVHVFICSPALTAEDPNRSEKGFLQNMADEGLALAKSLGAGTIDIQRGMREIQRRIWAANAREADPKKKTTLHAEDGIHLNDLGQLAMGYVMLKGLGAPAEVSSVLLDAQETSLLQTDGCHVTDVQWHDGRVEFVRLDEGLPLNLGILGVLQFRFIPIPDNLNRYMLTVRNLKPGRYEIRAEGRRLGTATERQLHEGLNIASMTADPWEPGGPWDAQAGVVKELTEARDRLTIGGLLRNSFLPDHPRRNILARQSAEMDDRLVALQRDTARPFPYHFEVRAQPSQSPVP
jgi:lysophospholipase L1-like esterase